jgi:hypothetical protein
MSKHIPISIISLGITGTTKSKKKTLKVFKRTVSLNNASEENKYQKLILTILFAIHSRIN